MNKFMQSVKFSFIIFIGILQSIYCIADFHFENRDWNANLGCPDDINALKARKELLNSALIPQVINNIQGSQNYLAETRQKEMQTNVSIAVIGEQIEKLRAELSNFQSQLPELKTQREAWIKSRSGLEHFSAAFLNVAPKLVEQIRSYLSNKDRKFNKLIDALKKQLRKAKMIDEKIEIKTQLEILSQLNGLILSVACEKPVALTENKSCPSRESLIDKLLNPSIGFETLPVILSMDLKLLLSAVRDLNREYKTSQDILGLSLAPMDAQIARLDLQIDNTEKQILFNQKEISDKTGTREELKRNLTQIISLINELTDRVEHRFQNELAILKSELQSIEEILSKCL